MTSSEFTKQNLTEQAYLKMSHSEAPYRIIISEGWKVVIWETPNTVGLEGNRIQKKKDSGKNMDAGLDSEAFNAAPTCISCISGRTEHQRGETDSGYECNNCHRGLCNN
jgi:hypothetical protein